MIRLRRAIGILPPLALILAACAGTNQAGTATEDTASMPAGSHDMGSGASMSAAASESADASAQASDGAAAGGRVSVDDVLTDPSAFEDQEVTLSENVDQVLVPESAFVFSGTEVEGQVLVLVSPDATIGKEVEANRVVNATGILVPFTAEQIEGAGIGLAVDDEALGDFEGDLALIATEIADPLGG